jgi:hypothetical protein
MPAYYTLTNFRTWIEINLNMPLMRLSRILMEGPAFKVLALFLIGIYTGRQSLVIHRIGLGYAFPYGKVISLKRSIS